MGPFPEKQFKVQTMAMNRSRPSISVNFNIPFSGLCHGMQVMHRSGFSVTDLNTGEVNSSPQAQKTSGKSDLRAKNSQKPLTKTASPKNAKDNLENTSETAKKSEKSSSPRAKRQRRK